MKKVLTIAGSDSSGGAGIQADIKTITAHKMYAMSAITALTAQNTTGVYGIMDATPEFVGQQLDCIFQDIRPDSVKIGMVSNSEIIRVIVEKLKAYDAKNIVVDPVMVSTSGFRLISEEAGDALINLLLPLADVITPNIPESEVLWGAPIKNQEDMMAAGRAIYQKMADLKKANLQQNEAGSEHKGAVLVKGGHLVSDAVDFLYTGEKESWFSSKRIDNPNTHGTGCTLSSAIACNLAAGYTLEESIQNAKDYLTGALAAMLDLGQGSGPMDHTYRI